MKRARAIKFLCLVLALAAVAAALTACANDPPPSVPATLSLSGRITLDGEPLPGVTVLADGAPVAESDRSGVFSVTLSEEGAVVAFALEGYTFSPDGLTVTEIINDLAVRATRVPADDPEPEPEPEPDPEPEPEPEPENLEAPADMSASDGVLTLTADPRAQGMVFSFGDGASETVPVGAESFTAGGKEFSVTFSEESGVLRIAVDISALAEPGGAAYTLIVSLYAEGCLPSDEARCDAVFPPEAPRIFGLAFDDATRTLSWRAENIPEGASFVVFASGVAVCETDELSAVLSALPAGEFELTVAAVADGTPLLFSSPLGINLA